MKPIGSFLWQDLTVEDAKDIKKFYESVVGWEFSEQSMGKYDDYNVQDAEENIIAGICHAKGVNKNIPPQWLLYVKVSDVAQSAKECKALGGKIIEGPRMMGKNNFAVIQDPAGAIIAIIEDH
jgi:predicted enzyme related to lactoylglutathione lyase